MLINTVLLFLQDALAIFLLATLLLLIAHKLKLPHTWLYQSTIVSIICVFFLHQNIAVIAQSFDGIGLEFSFSVGFFIVYLSVVLLFLFNKQHGNLLIWYTFSFISLVLVISLNSANFLIYLGGYSLQTAGYEPLVIGMIIAAGICISVAILLYFSLLYCDNKNYFINSRLFLLLFGAGQLIKASHLLEQVDIFPSGAPLWDSNYIIAESSEAGQFFMALLGYDATPSIMQVTLYISAIITPTIMLFISEKMFKPIDSTRKFTNKHALYQQGQK